MKLYTRRGDGGTTDLFGGRRVAKDDLRVEAYGSVDELNSFIGLALCGCRAESEMLAGVLSQTQNRLFDLGAELASPEALVAQTGAPADSPAAAAGKAPEGPAPACSRGVVHRVSTKQIEEVEDQIDAACSLLPELRQFILPGGSELSARLHVARCVCRRAERLCVALAAREPLNPNVVVYLNRLSDLLFAMARVANLIECADDVPWQKSDEAPTA
jgi:cob(I)alamin adenosyltransferase